MRLYSIDYRVIKKCVSGPGGMRMAGKIEVLGKNTASVSLSPQQIPHDLIWGRINKSMFTSYYWTAFSESNTSGHSDVQVEKIKFISYDTY